MASCAEYRNVAKAFGVSITSVHRYLYLFCNALSKRKHTYIKWYTDEDAAAIADNTRGKYIYPQSIGAIDGTHIPVTPPLDGKADYLCRKGYPSIVVQAVTDGNCIFRDVYANTPGSAHDASVFRRSPLHGFLDRKMPKRDIELNGDTVPLHILGDPAYPISQHIVKGYTGRNLTNEQESFNVYLSSARMIVEISFGKLKSRFRILRKTIDADISIAPKIITACCILHNICEKNRLPLPPRVDHEEPDPDQPDRIIINDIDDNGGEHVRTVITNYLAENHPLLRSFHL